jgi:Tol biopolymer transport system component
MDFECANATMAANAAWQKRARSVDQTFNQYAALLTWSLRMLPAACREVDFAVAGACIHSGLSRIHWLSCLLRHKDRSAMTTIRIPSTLLAIAALIAACGKNEIEEPAPTITAAPATYGADAFFTTTSYALAGGYAWSPDDTALLVSSDETGIFNVYALASADGAKTPLTTSTTDSTYAVSWFPNDVRVLFTADQGGNELDHLFVRELHGETRDLTPGDKVKAEFLGWSGDGAFFFAYTNERDAQAFDVYRYSSKDYARTLIFENVDAFDVSSISPDGSTIALVKPRTSADSDIYLLDTTTADAEPQLITAHEGNVSHGVYAFTRDSKTLVYSTNEHGEFDQAWSYDLDSGEKAPLVSANWDVLFVSFSHSGRYRVSGTNDDARTVVRILDSTTGKELELPGLPPGDLAQIRFSRDENKIALMLSTDTSPNDVYTVNLAAGANARLTHALNPAINENDLVATAVVRYPSYDGVEIPSILYRPKVASATNKVPALVWVHGGPGGQSRTGYSAIQHRQSWLRDSRREQPRVFRLRQDLFPPRRQEARRSGSAGYRQSEGLSLLARLGGRRAHRHHRRVLRRLHGWCGTRFRTGSVRCRRQHLRRDELGAHTHQHSAVVGVVQGGAVR